MARKTKKKAESDNELDRFAGGDYDFFTKEVDRMFKDGTVKVSDASEMVDPESNSTGSLGLDYDLAVPFPEGAVVEVYGDESSYKTSLALQAVAEALNNGKHCLIINAERSLNRRHLASIKKLRPFLEEGAENRLKLVKMTTGEEALNTMKLYASQFPRSMVVLDSVDACLPEAVITGNIGDQKVGNQSKLMSDALRKLIGVADENRVTLVFINQMRSKITMYGDPNDTSGGRALKYYAHQRIQMKKAGKAQIITDSDGERIGVKMRYVVIKNKFNPAGQEGEIPLLYGYGVNDAEELLDMCLKFGLIAFGGRGGKQILVPTWKEVPLKNEDDEVVMVDGTSDEPVMTLELDESEDGLKARPRATAVKMFLNDDKMREEYSRRLELLLNVIDTEEEEEELGVQDAQR